MFLRHSNLVHLPQAADLILAALKYLHIDLFNRRARVDRVENQTAAGLAVSAKERLQICARQARQG